MIFLSKNQVGNTSTEEHVLKHFQGYQEALQRHGSLLSWGMATQLSAEPCKHGQNQSSSEARGRLAT